MQRTILQSTEITISNNLSLIVNLLCKTDDEQVEFDKKTEDKVQCHWNIYDLQLDGINSTSCKTDDDQVEFDK